MEHGVHKAPDVLKQNRLWAHFVNNAQCFWEKVTLIGGTKLLSSLRKRRARNTTGHKINTSKRPRVELGQVGLLTFDYVPLGAIQHQCLATPIIDFNKSLVAKTGPFNTKSLAACTSA
jgi:hypothetical protein